MLSQKLRDQTTCEILHWVVRFIFFAMMFTRVKSQEYFPVQIGSIFIMSHYNTVNFINDLIAEGKIKCTILKNPMLF